MDNYSNHSRERVKYINSSNTIHTFKPCNHINYKIEFYTLTTERILNETCIFKLQFNHLNMNYNEQSMELTARSHTQ